MTTVADRTLGTSPVTAVDEVCHVGSDFSRWTECGRLAPVEPDCCAHGNPPCGRPPCPDCSVEVEGRDSEWRANPLGGPSEAAA